jgi:sirohydrochlorin cobaltochelatase
MTDPLADGSPVMVLAVHGAPPRDFPAHELAEYFGLHARREMAGGGATPSARESFLEQRLRGWSRTAANDPFWAASVQMGALLGQAASRRVIVGFNEFCAPSVDEALEQAAAICPPRIVVVTPMLTRGGEHAEADIPAAIDRARARHPGIVIEYAWPYDPHNVARFLVEHLRIAEMSERRVT